ncbi:MAG: hypothetical protein ACXADD_15555 [Candidatus Thorarchaeota archaeon]
MKKRKLTILGLAALVVVLMFPQGVEAKSVLISWDDSDGYSSRIPYQDGTGWHKTVYKQSGYIGAWGNNDWGYAALQIELYKDFTPSYTGWVSIGASWSFSGKLIAHFGGMASVSVKYYWQSYQYVWPFGWRWLTHNSDLVWDKIAPAHGNPIAFYLSWPSSTDVAEFYLGAGILTRVIVKVSFGMIGDAEIYDFTGSQSYADFNLNELVVWKT